MQSSTSQNPLQQGDNIGIYTLIGESAIDRTLRRLNESIRLNESSKPMFHRFGTEDLPGILEATLQSWGAPPGTSVTASRLVLENALRKTADDQTENESLRASAEFYKTTLDLYKFHETAGATPASASHASGVRTRMKGGWTRMKDLSELGIEVCMTGLATPRLSKAINLLNKIEGPLMQASSCQESEGSPDGQGEISMDTIYKDLRTVCIVPPSEYESTGLIGPYPKPALLRSIKTLGRRYEERTLHSADPIVPWTLVLLSNLHKLVDEISQLDDDSMEDLNSASPTDAQPSTVPQSQHPSSTNQLEDVTDAE